MADDKELKDQRVPIMMTPSELEAIDDWMFKNRIRSRGEAIRRLCQMALGVEGQSVTLTERILDLSNLVFEMLDPDRMEEPDRDAVFRSIFALMDAHAAFIVPFGQMRMGESVEEAIQNVSEWRARMTERDAHEHAGSAAADTLLEMARATPRRLKKEE